MLIASEGMAEYDKVVAVHDWLCTNCTYNVTSISNGVILGSDHSADGPLLYGLSVCEGYAEAFKLFMDILGIKNRRVDGWAQGYHSWNEVFIGDQWLAVDVTWDDPVIIGGPDSGGVYTRQYCLITPEQMAADHMACEYH